MTLFEQRKREYELAVYSLSSEQWEEFQRAMKGEPLQLEPIGRVPEILRALNLLYRVLDLVE